MINVYPLYMSTTLSCETKESSFEKAKDAARGRIQRRGDLPHISVEKQLELLEELAQFELGRFLIEHGQLNGYWTEYVVSPHKNSRIGSLEDFLLNKAPMALATQERALIFKREIQKRLKNGSSVASIPCGLMGDLLDLDFSAVSSVTLYGIDLDPQALESAQSKAHERGFQDCCIFSSQDAWNFKIDASLDVISCNGLNIYEARDDRCIELYQGLYQSLKHAGILITSFLSLPSEWKLDCINPADAHLQRILLTDVLSPKFQAYRSEKDMKAQLEKAGFTVIETLYDRARVFPTVIAQK